MKITKIVAGLVLMGIMTSGFANQGDSTGSSLGTTGTVMSNPASGIGLVTGTQVDTSIANKINQNNLLINQQLATRDAQIAALIAANANLQNQLNTVKTSVSNSGIINSCPTASFILGNNYGGGFYYFQQIPQVYITPVTHTSNNSYGGVTTVRCINGDHPGYTLIDFGGW